MNPTICTSLAIALCSALGACAGAPTATYNLRSENLADHEVAIIRSASEQEQQYQPSKAAKIFAAPATTARIQSIMVYGDEATKVPLHRYGSSRVAPGVYTVRVTCMVGGFSVYLDMPINAQAGKDHLVECVGSTLKNARITERVVDRE
jgi:hypothetical protein